MKFRDNITRGGWIMFGIALGLEVVGVLFFVLAMLLLYSGRENLPLFGITIFLAPVLLIAAGILAILAARRADSHGSRAFVVMLLLLALLVAVVIVVIILAITMRVSSREI